ncbi:MAG: AGE family epimerase/isomerase [Acholeplasmataceae bacterium]
MRDAIEKHLNRKIIPFWNRMKDKDYGGYYGFVGLDLKVDRKADKGAVKTARILYSYATMARHERDPEHLAHAKIAYDYLINNLYDHGQAGVFWKSRYDGRIIDDQKHLYANCFAIYGLAEYALAARDSRARDYAMTIFDSIERHAYEPAKNCYHEAFDRHWKPIENRVLSAYGIVPVYTTNVVLHQIEAYTKLYEACGDPEVKKSLVRLLNAFYLRIYDRSTHRLGILYDENWNSLVAGTSYGHDIEASWLVDEAMRVIDYRREALERMTLDLARSVLREGWRDGKMITDRIEGEESGQTVWWVLAEALVGFMNAYQKTNEKAFYDASHSVWEAIERHIVDHRDQGEWFWSVDSQGKPIDSYGVSENWKANYHNVRACLEVIKRSDSQ